VKVFYGAMDSGSEKDFETSIDEKGGTENDNDDQLKHEEDHQNSHDDEEEANCDYNQPDKSVLRNVEGMGSMTTIDNIQLESTVSSSDGQCQEGRQKSNRRSRSTLREQQRDDSDSSLSPPPAATRITPQSISNTQRGLSSDTAEAPPLLESHSSAPGAYHVGSTFASMISLSRVQLGRGGGQPDDSRYHGERNDSDLIEDGNSTTTSVLAAVLPRYGMPSGIQAPLPPGRLTRPSRQGRMESGGSQLTMDTDLNSLVPADSTPDAEYHEAGSSPPPSSSSWGNHNYLLAGSSQMAVVHAHVVVEQSLEEQLAAEIEARLQAEFRGQVEQEVNRKLGAIATAEVVVPNNYNDYSGNTRVHGLAISAGNNNNDYYPTTLAETVDIDGDEGLEGRAESSVPKAAAERKRLMPRIVIVFLVALAAVGTFVLVRLLRPDDVDDSNQTISPTFSPPGGNTISPSTVPEAFSGPTLSPKETSLRHDSMRQVLLGVSNEEDLDDESSPQYRAMEWLVNLDGLQLDPIPSYDLYQRYTVVVLYFATNGELWKQNFDFLANTSICNWNSIEARQGLLCHDGTGDLEHLYLANNRLRDGPLPPEIGSLTSLDTLEMSFNNVGGKIPSTVGRLANLTSLLLSTNRLTGSLPSEIQEMKNLKVIDASNNILSGPIPSLSISGLQGIYVESNRLTGNLSGMLGDPTILQDLVFLGLGMNQISGTIPSTICNLISLSGLFLYSNDMTGEIPTCLNEMEKLCKI
jgi:hypothetical protein